MWTYSNGFHINIDYVWRWICVFCIAVASLCCEGNFQFSRLFDASGAAEMMRRSKE